MKYIITIMILLSCNTAICQDSTAKTTVNYLDKLRMMIRDTASMKTSKPGVYRLPTLPIFTEPVCDVSNSKTPCVDRMICQFNGTLSKGIVRTFFFLVVWDSGTNHEAFRLDYVNNKILLYRRGRKDRYVSKQYAENLLHKYVIENHHRSFNK